MQIYFCSKALESGMSLHCVKDLAGERFQPLSHLSFSLNYRLYRIVYYSRNLRSLLWSINAIRIF